MREIPWHDEPENLHRCFAILNGLIALRKAGAFQCIWCDDWTISVRRGQPWAPRERLSWDAAEAIVMQAGRKPVQSADAPDARETRAA